MKNVENAADLCPHLEIFKAYMSLEHGLHEEARTDDVIEEISLNLNALEVSDDEKGWIVKLLLIFQYVFVHYCQESLCLAFFILLLLLLVVVVVVLLSLLLLSLLLYCE